MADVLTTFSVLSNDAPNVYIARETFRLAERNLRIGKYAKLHQVPQRMGKTLRVVRYKRINLPVQGGTLGEGVPPDAVALATENVDVTLEQWGIVVLLTDVAEITTTHPALQIAIDRTALAMSEVLEREQATMLLAGTQVYFPGAKVRTTLAASDKMDTATILKTTVALRNLGAAEGDGGLYNGVMAAQQEGDVLSADQTFKDASNFANVRKLEYGEIGVWMATRWSRSNFLPILKGQVAPDAAAASGTLDAGTLKPQVTTSASGGTTIGNAQNYKFVVVFRDKTTDYERHITQTSANIASAANAAASFNVVVPAATLTNYYYDVYITVAGGAGSLFKVLSRQTTATSAVIGAQPLGTEAVAPTAPAANVEVFIAWVFGQDSFGRVELNGMSLQSYITPPGASYSNPLAQGRKIGSKIMWKSFIIDNNFFARIETGSSFSAGLPSG